MPLSAKISMKALSGMLVAAIKEQQTIIAKQAEENKILKNEILKIKKVLGIL